MITDEQWMQRALRQARRGVGHVHPNPLVGAVIVKSGRLVAEGYHRAFGRPHAEVEALARAGTRARGATLYVNLEPCVHWGKTGPCASAVIAAGIRRVVAAMRDPNPRVAGRGFAALRRAGVTVVSDVGSSAARALNRAFVQWITKGRPFVTLKAAASLDGKTATRSGESQWITGPAARGAGHALRLEADAIAVGIQTILQDDPRLTTHTRGRNPIRIIFDSHLRTPVTARVLHSDAPTWIFSLAAAPQARKMRLEKMGAQVVSLPADREGRILLSEAMAALATQGVTHLLVEGGATLAGAFLEAKFVDEIAWFMAPLLIGRAMHLRHALRLRDVTLRRLRDDWVIRGAVA